MARLLLAIREGDSDNIAHALSRARMALGNPIVATGGREYRHTYEAVLNLHLVHEVELIHRLSSEQMQTDRPRRNEAQDELNKILDVRLNSTLPSFRTREPILSLRRTAYGIRLVLSVRPKLYSRIDLTICQSTAFWCSFRGTWPLLAGHRKNSTKGRALANSLQCYITGPGVTHGVLIDAKSEAYQSNWRATACPARTGALSTDHTQSGSLGGCRCNRSYRR